MYLFPQGGYVGREKMEIGKEGGEKKNEWGNLVFILPNPHGENRIFFYDFSPTGG